MDTLVHGVLGAALFSRTGIAGGVRGPVDGRGRRKIADWTFWAAFGFGILPDVASIGIHFMTDWFTGNGVRWHGIPDYVFTLYRITHSLAGMAVCIGLLALWKRQLLLPLMAWPFHVLTDVPTHGDGRFMTPLLWPFSEWGFSGWNWWTVPGLFYGAWLAAGALWLAVAAARIAGWIEARRKWR